MPEEHGIPELLGESARAPVPRLSLRPNDAAFALGISVRLLRTWVEAGKISPSVRIGSTALFAVSDLEEWLRSGGELKVREAKPRA